MRRRLWTKEELILALDLYFKLETGEMHTRTPKVITLADLLKRPVNSIALRLANYISCDPEQQQRGVKGMIGGLKQCQPIWDEFANDRKKLDKVSKRILLEKYK